MKSMFAPNYWGRLPQFEIPHSIVQDDKLILKPNALTMLLILLEVARAKQSRNRDPIIEVKIAQKRLEEKSGFSKNAITAAMKELEDKKFLRRVSDQRRMRGEFGANVYLICNPADAEPLVSNCKNFLYGNRVRYIRLPKCVVAESSPPWSLAKMTGSEVRLYVTLCWLANKHGANQYHATAAALRSLAAFCTDATFCKALDGLQDKGLIWTASSQDTKELGVTLCDPYTGEPLHQQTEDAQDDPANYFVTPAGGRARRVDLNAGNPEEVESLVCACLPAEASVVRQNNGNFKIRCPFHSDIDPSCSVSPTKRCFYCFGCKKSGTITELVMELRGIDKRDAIRYIANHHGQCVEFHEPDKNAEGIYSYLDETGKLLKQKIRYSGKRFVQRQPHRSGGWIWNVNGVKTTLYNLHRLLLAHVVCICEGEKDCDNVMELSLCDAYGGEVVAVTSGGADSWEDQLADDLRQKKVVLMPDDDAAGKRFAAEVAESLDSRKVEHRTVTFTDFGAKDVSDFLRNGGTVGQLAQRIGADWARTSGAPSLVEGEDQLVEP
jgi:5S rRNA maturation endonuclease (ribonuclease M5)